MPKIANYRRLSAEDYQQDFQPLVEKMSYVINDHMRNVTDLVNGSIDFDNTTWSYLSINITVNTSNKPVGNAKVNVGKSRVLGTQVINAKPTNSTSLATAQPFITYTELGNNLIRIDQITGLQPNIAYTLNVIVY